MHRHRQTFPQSLNRTMRKTVHALLRQLPLQARFYRFPEVRPAVHPLEVSHQSRYIFQDYAGNQRLPARILLLHPDQPHL